MRPLRTARALATPAATCLLLALAACQPLDSMLGTFGAFNVVTLTTLGRSVPDVVVSFLRDRDCSVVRLEQGVSYCVPPDPPPEPAELCTRTLGRVDCWAHPALMPGHPLAVADTPAMTSAQLLHAAHRWPDSWSPAPSPDLPGPPHGVVPP